MLSQADVIEFDAVVSALNGCREIREDVNARMQLIMFDQKQYLTK